MPKIDYDNPPSSLALDHPLRLAPPRNLTESHHLRQARSDSSLQAQAPGDNSIYSSSTSIPDYLGETDSDKSDPFSSSPYLRRGEPSGSDEPQRKLPLKRHQSMTMLISLFGTLRRKKKTNGGIKMVIRSQDSIIPAQETAHSTIPDNSFHSLEQDQHIIIRPSTHWRSDIGEHELPYSSFDPPSAPTGNCRNEFSDFDSAHTTQYMAIGPSDNNPFSTPLPSPSSLGPSSAPPTQVVLSPLQTSFVTRQRPLSLLTSTSVSAPVSPTESFHQRKAETARVLSQMKSLQILGIEASGAVREKYRAQQSEFGVTPCGRGHGYGQGA